MERKNDKGETKEKKSLRLPLLDWTNEITASDHPLNKILRVKIEAEKILKKYLIDFFSF